MKAKEKLMQVAFGLPPALLEQLDELASSAKVSRGWVLRDAVEFYVASRQKVQPMSPNEPEKKGRK